MCIDDAGANSERREPPCRLGSATARLRGTRDGAVAMGRCVCWAVRGCCRRRHLPWDASSTVGLQRHRLKWRWRRQSRLGDPRSGRCLAVTSSDNSNRSTSDRDSNDTPPRHGTCLEVADPLAVSNDHRRRGNFLRRSLPIRVFWGPPSAAMASRAPSRRGFVLELHRPARPQACHIGIAHCRRALAGTHIKPAVLPPGSLHRFPRLPD